MHERVDLTQNLGLGTRAGKFDHASRRIDVFHTGVHRFLRLVYLTQAIQPGVGHVHHAYMSFKLASRSRGAAVGAREYGEQGGLAHLVKTNNTDSEQRTTSWVAVPGMDSTELLMLAQPG